MNGCNGIKETRRGTVVHVEVIQKTRSTVNPKTLEESVRDMLEAIPDLVLGTKFLPSDLEDNAVLRNEVRSIHVDERRGIRSVGEGARFRVHVYRPDRCGGGTDTLEGGDEAEGGASAAATRWSLPSEEFVGLWDALVFDGDVKDDLLDAAETSLLFSDRGVDPNAVSLNRTVLLHGPPGTGKTSLCRALAQKLAVRTAHRYRDAQLVEINSHSLFSKWFSESGKLVMRLFDRIDELAEDGGTLVCVLIDEVESLAHARNAALSGVEPSDSLRAVNATLTQMDRIRRRPNVLVLTTSNVTAAIDAAFVDRADIKRHLGRPSATAARHIYRSCIAELMRTGLVESTETLDTTTLCELAERSAAAGLSGRTLRKIPYLAYARLIDSERVNLESFLDAMMKSVAEHASEEQLLVDRIKDVRI